MSTEAGSLRLAHTQFPYSKDGRAIGKKTRLRLTCVLRLGH